MERNISPGWFDCKDASGLRARNNRYGGPASKTFPKAAVRRGIEPAISAIQRSAIAAARAYHGWIRQVADAVSMAGSRAS